MLADFDWLIGIGILLAIWFSNQPKRSAVVFVLFVAASVKAIDVFVDAGNGWLAIYLTAILEASAAILMILMAVKLPELKDRQFFWLMAVMLWISSGVTLAFIKIGLPFWGEYIFMTELISVIHLLIMLSFSDGIRNFIGSLRNSFIANRGGFTNS